MKIHYSTKINANESDTQDYWSRTACGLEYTESPMTNNKISVTCKKCLQIIKISK